MPQLPQFCVNVLSYKYILFLRQDYELIQGQTRRVTIFTIQPTFKSDVLCKTLYNLRPRESHDNKYQTAHARTTHHQRGWHTV